MFIIPVVLAISLLFMTGAFVVTVVPSLSRVEPICPIGSIDASCIPLRIATINEIAPDSTTARFNITAGIGISITPDVHGIVLENTGVTSVALDVPSSFLNLTGSPVTSTGTLTVSLIDQPANAVFAGPVTGSPAPPAFRPQVLADLPQLSDGELYVGSTGSSVAAATITAGSGISVTNGAGSITITAIGGGSGTVTSVGLALPSFISVSGSPVSTSGTLTGTLATQSANRFFVGPTTGAASAPTFRAQVLADLPQLTDGQLYVGSTGTAVAAATLTAGAGISITNGAGSITITNTGGGGGGGSVTSVGLSLPSFITVSGSPVTTSGTLTGTLATQSANTLFAGPTTGAAAAPTFRSQVIADLPHLTDGQLYVGSTGTSVAAATITAGSGISVTNGAGSITITATGSGGSVTSVGLSLPSFITVSGSPVTTAGTLTGTLATQTANTLFAGPTTGAASAPTFRSQVIADLPHLTDGQLYVGSTGTSVAAATLTAGTGISVTNGAGSITVANTGVTSVALSVPSIFSVSGSPVTTTGTLTASLATQSSNTLFAGPASGGAAAPTFRTQVLADLPHLTDGQLYIGSTGTSVAAATLTAGSGIQITNAAGGITITNIGPGSGTVTSVALSMPSIFSVSGSPVTSSGTITASLATQSANTIWAGPTTGAAAAPTFRAIVPADLTSAFNANNIVSDSSTTINTDGYLVMGGLSVTPAAGTYHVSFNADVLPCSSCTVLLGIAVAGIYQVGATQTLDLAQRVNVATQRLLTVDGTQEVAVMWNSFNVGTTTCYGRSLTLIRVG